MSYCQYMEHWKNHRKDRYTQPLFYSASSSNGRKEDFPISIDGETFFVIAYCIEEALSIAKKYYPTAKIKPA